MPALLAVGHIPGPVVFEQGALFGHLSEAPPSVTLSAARFLLPLQTGIGSGIVLGLGFVAGGIGVEVSRVLDERITTDQLR